MNLIILGITSKGGEKTERWVKTLRSFYDGKIVLVLTSDPDKVEYFKNKYNIEVLNRQEDDSFWGHSENGLALGRWKYIKEVSHKYYNHFILVTDVWDVIWQDDPRKYISDIKKSSFYLSYEGMLNKQNYYMVNWVIYSKYLQKIRDLGYFDFPTFCCGSVLSYAEGMEELSDYILKNDLNCYTDQALLSCFLLEKRKEFVYIPNFMESLADHFKEGKIKDNKILGKEDIIWCMVHANGNTKNIIENLNYE